MYDEYDEWSEQQHVRPIRCCERCGAGENASKPDPLCLEVQMAFGLVAWLCHDCRKEWYRHAKNLPIQSKYAEAALRLEFWKACIGVGTPSESINEGLELWHGVDACEKEINDYANEWLITTIDERRSS